MNARTGARERRRRLPRIQDAAPWHWQEHASGVLVTPTLSPHFHLLLSWFCLNPPPILCACWPPWSCDIRSGVWIYSQPTPHSRVQPAPKPHHTVRPWPATAFSRTHSITSTFQNANNNLHDLLQNPITILFKSKSAKPTQSLHENDEQTANAESLNLTTIIGVARFTKFVKLVELK